MYVVSGVQLFVFKSVLQYREAYTRRKSTFFSVPSTIFFSFGFSVFLDLCSYRSRETMGHHKIRDLFRKF